MENELKKKFGFKKIAYFVVAAIVVFIASAVILVFYFSRDLPIFSELPAKQLSQSTKIYDRSGKILLYEINAEQKRTVIPFEEIPPFLKDATIAIEDENFYQHQAFSWRAILRAVLANLFQGQIVQGGSTITQQLAKVSFLTPERTLSRKIKELILAIQLERRYSKDQILTLYFNTIPYGSNLYGVEVASQNYFNKSAKDLNLAEAAILAAIPRAPTYYSPWGSHTDELKERQRYILKKMLTLEKISETQEKAALKTKIVFSVPSGNKLKAPHFVMAVQDYLIKKYGEDLMRTGGLKVMTTLDWNFQLLAEKAVAEGAAQNEKLYEGKNAALVAQDGKTGQVLALVGSRDYFDTKNEGNFNVATQGLRQPGSALKPFVYLTAFQGGYTDQTIVFDLPTEFVPNNPACSLIVDFNNENSRCYHPQNFDEKFRGPVSLRQGLAQSINIPSVKTLYLAGLNEVLKNAEKFGLTTLNDPDRYGLSLVLGGGEVKLIDLVEAYSILSQEGVKHRQVLVLKIEDGQGKTLEEYKDEARPIIELQYPRLINDILSDTEARAGLFQSSLNLTIFPDHDVALKTGTTNDYRDAWAIGYTPSLVVGVWAGNNDNSPMQRHGSSILAAIPIWHNFMIEALKKYPSEPFGRAEPTIADKPILRGDYLANNQIHSILYYLDKDNPLGPAPANPDKDPQFQNWELPVLAWANQNLKDFSSFNQPLTVNSQISSPAISDSPPKIQIFKPLSGDFIQQSIDFNAQINSEKSVKKISIYLNNALIQEFTGDFGKTYQFQWTFQPPNLELQNILKIEAENLSGFKESKEIIIFK